MLTQNAASAEVLERSYTRLQRGLKELERVACAPKDAEQSTTDARLGAIRERLAQYFRLEEEDGYMDQVPRRDPSAVRAFTGLMAERSRLMQSLGTIIEASKSNDFRLSEIDSIRGMITDWIRALRQYETRKNVLTEDAFDQDIGDKD